MARSGRDLALLMLAGYQKLVDAAVVELEALGYSNVRPVHHYSLRAIAAGADNASELGRRMDVSKQAAAKTIAALVESGYVTVDPDPSDARRRKLRVSQLGNEVMQKGEAIFDDLRRDWEAQLGVAQVDSLERLLRAAVGEATIRLDTPGWVASAN